MQKAGNSKYMEFTSLQPLGAIIGAAFTSHLQMTKDGGVWVWLPKWASLGELLFAGINTVYLFFFCLSS